MEFRFDATLYSIMGNENSGAGHNKCLGGPHVPRPCFKLTVYQTPEVFPQANTLI